MIRRAQRSRRAGDRQGPGLPRACTRPRRASCHSEPHARRPRAVRALRHARSPRQSRSARPHQTLHCALVIALARAPVPVPDEVVREKSAEQPRAPARPVALNARHQTPVVVVHIDNATAPKNENACTCPSTHASAVAARYARTYDASLCGRSKAKKCTFCLTPAMTAHAPEISLRVPRRMRQRHEHLPAMAAMLTNVVLHDRVPTGESVLVTKTFEDALRRVRCFR